MLSKIQICLSKRMELVAISNWKSCLQAQLDPGTQLPGTQLPLPTLLLDSWWETEARRLSLASTFSGILEKEEFV